MGFPVVHTDLFLPKVFVFLLTFLGFIRKVIRVVFKLLGFGEFLDPEMTNPTREDCGAALIRELLPVVKFSDLGEFEITENCAVCLYDFEGDDDIRRLTNCRHIFHLSCLDRWMDHDQKTCPLCRTRVFPEDLQDSFNESLWEAAGIFDYYGE